MGSEDLGMGKESEVEIRLYLHKRLQHKSFILPKL